MQHCDTVKLKWNAASGYLLRQGLCEVCLDFAAGECCQPAHLWRAAEHL